MKSATYLVLLDVVGSGCGALRSPTECTHSRLTKSNRTGNGIT